MSITKAKKTSEQLLSHQYIQANRQSLFFTSFCSLMSSYQLIQSLALIHLYIFVITQKLQPVHIKDFPLAILDHYGELEMYLFGCHFFYGTSTECNSFNKSIIISLLLNFFPMSRRIQRMLIGRIQKSLSGPCFPVSQKLGFHVNLSACYILCQILHEAFCSIADPSQQERAQ